MNQIKFDEFDRDIVFATDLMKILMGIKTKHYMTIMNLNTGLWVHFDC